MFFLIEIFCKVEFNLCIRTVLLSAFLPRLVIVKQKFYLLLLYPLITYCKGENTNHNLLSHVQFNGLLVMVTKSYNIVNTKGCQWMPDKIE